MELLIENITKQFGPQVVFSHIQLELAGAAVYCLLGKNGAGKSTIINIVADLLEPDQGRVLVDGMGYEEDGIEIKRIIGLQSQYDMLIDELSAGDYLRFIGLIYRVDKTECEIQIKNLLEYFFEEDAAKLSGRIKNYSSGMRKKLSLCAALLHKPKLLLLDEPFANLDPLASDKLCRLLNAYIHSERIIFISSHDLLYVDKVATHVGVLDAGRLVFNGTADLFKDHGRERLDTNLLKYLNTGSGLPERIPNLI